MDLGESLHIWRRRWILTAVVLILVSVGASATAVKLRTYESDSTMVLLASRSVSKQNGGNPFLSFSPSLTLTADALSRETMSQGTIQDLRARGFLGKYTVALAPYTTTTTGSVLLVSVTGPSKAEVQSTLQAVTGKIDSELLQLQTHSGVKPRNRIRAGTLAYTPRATLSLSQTARPVVAVTALGLLIGLGIPVLADGRAARRRMRRQRRVFAAEALNPVDAVAYDRSPSRNGAARKDTANMPR